MSNGPFLRAFYSSAITGKIHPIRIQPESASLVIDGVTNTIPAGPADDPRQMKISQRRGIGKFAQKVGVRVTGAGTSGFAVGTVHYVPWLNGSTLASVIEPLGKTGSYLGASVEVIGYSPER